MDSMTNHNFAPKHHLGLNSPTSPAPQPQQSQSQQPQFRHPFLPPHVRMNHPNNPPHQMQVRPSTPEFRQLIPSGSQSPSQAMPLPHVCFYKYF